MKKEINEFINNTIGNINEMIDTVKTVGQVIVIDENTKIIPVSKMTFGFGSGGSEFVLNNKKKEENYLFETSSENLPFGGGTLLGVNVTPEAYLIIRNNDIKIIKHNDKNDVYDILIDTIKNTINKKK